MAAVDTDDIVEVVVKGKFNGADDIVSVYQAKITDPQGGSAAEVVAWVEQWLEELVTPLALSLSPLYSTPESLVTNLTQDTFLGQITSTFVGLGTGEATSPQICALIMARTAAPKVQGRKYVGVFGEEMQSGGVWTEDMITALDLTAQVWQDSFQGGFDVVGQGQVVTKDAAGDLVTSRDITGYRIICDTRTQRRRTLGRGS